MGMASTLLGIFTKFAAMAGAVKTKPKVLIIAGTTSVGKTDLSLELSRRLNGEVISADSIQIYKHLDIGSAKITPKESSGIPHHLLDVASVMETFTAGDYCSLAARTMEEIISRGRVPLVVGGTGLYIRTLMQGPTGAPPTTPESRALVEALVEQDQQNWETSLARLSALDPEYASILMPNDWYRLKRALEICTLSGSDMTLCLQLGCPYDFKCLFLSMPRVQLFHRIDARCEAIIEQGLFPVSYRRLRNGLLFTIPLHVYDICLWIAQQEVISLVNDHGLVLESQAGRSVGYRQVLEYLKDVWGFPRQESGKGFLLQIPKESLQKSFLEFLFTYQAKTRRLAHCQLVWYKKEPGFHWLNMAPQGQRLPLAMVADAVAQWFADGTPLPKEWEGQDLKELSPEEQLMLKEYSGRHSKPEVFSDNAKIDSLIQQIEACLYRTQN